MQIYGSLKYILKFRGILNKFKVFLDPSTHKVPQTLAPFQSCHKIGFPASDWPCLLIQPHHPSLVKICWQSKVCLLRGSDCIWNLSHVLLRSPFRRHWPVGVQPRVHGHGVGEPHVVTGGHAGQHGRHVVELETNSIGKNLAGDFAWETTSDPILIPWNNLKYSILYTSWCRICQRGEAEDDLTGVFQP